MARGALFPTSAVLYPARLRISAVVVTFCAPLMSVPESPYFTNSPEWRPVKKVVRLGAHTVYPVYAFVKRSPSAANLFRCGVAIRPCGEVAGKDSSSPHPRSSAMIQTMLGRSAADAASAGSASGSARL